MSNQGKVIQSHNNFMLLIAFCAITLGCALIGGILAAGLATLVYDVPLQDLNLDRVNSLNMNKVKALRFMQFLSAIITFLLPAYLFIKVIKKESVRLYLNLIKFPKISLLLLIPIIVLLANPFIYKSTEWTRLLGLSEIMKESSIAQTQVIKAFLSLEGIGNFLFNFVVMAIMAGFCEEILFRGVIQKGLQRFFKNYHIAIWITALIFSLIHMEFEGCIARMVLGAIFGYLYVFTGNLWIPIITHAFYNGFTITVAKLYDAGMVDMNVNEADSVEVGYGWFTVCSVCLIIVLIYFKKLSSN